MNMDCKQPAIGATHHTPPPHTTDVPHCSTLTHMAPESLAGQTQLNASIDLYAFGERERERERGGWRAADGGERGAFQQ